MREWTGDNWDGFCLMSRDEVRGFDAWAIDEMGIPGVVLMENAARGCLQVIDVLFGAVCTSGVCIFCGTGNNGGDGFVIARHLFNRGVSVRVVVCGEPGRIKGDAKVNYDICLKMGLSVSVLEPASADMCRVVEDAVSGCGLVVDALLGTGLTGALKEPMALLVSAINSHNVPIVAVDIPSGMACDTGEALPVCIEAEATVTFVAVKKGFAENPTSRQATGRVFVADVGITGKSKY